MLPLPAVGVVATVANVYFHQLPQHMEGWEAGFPPPPPPSLTTMVRWVRRLVSRSRTAQPLQSAAVGIGPPDPPDSDI